MMIVGMLKWLTLVQTVQLITTVHAADNGLGLTPVRISVLLAAPTVAILPSYVRTSF